MRKNGFTLIELIVVIAIIGVLAAILVPTMMGYVRKSKISSANESAAAIYKALNSALMELDEEGIDIGGHYIILWNSATEMWSERNMSDSMENAMRDNGLLEKKVNNFFDEMTKIKYCKAAVSSGACVAVAVGRDTTYAGTYPSGVVTNSNYEYYIPMDASALDSALADAIIVSGGGGITNAVSAQQGIRFAEEKGFTVEWGFNGNSKVKE